MAFEIVHHIPEELLKGGKRSRYLCKEDLTKLQERALVYFVRERYDILLGDYPYMGAPSHCIPRLSNITGPFETKPEPKEKKGWRSETIELLVPSSAIPLQLEAITYREYGTNIESTAMNHIYFHTETLGGKIDSLAILQKGRDALARLAAMAPEQTERGSTANSTEPDLMFNLTVELHQFYPLIILRAFGKTQRVEQLFKKSGLEDITALFRGADDLGIVDLTQDGFVIGPLDLTKEGENVITLPNKIL